MVTDRDAPVELIENFPVLGEGLPVTPLLQSNQFTPVLPQSGPNTSVASVQPQPGPTTSVTSALTQPGSNIYVTSVQPQPGTNTSASSGQPQPGSKTSGLPQPGSTTSVTSGLPQPGAKSSVTSTLPQLGPSTSVTLILAQPGPSSSTSSALAQTDSCSSPPPQLARMTPHVSPADIIPFPKAGPRKNNTRGRKRGDTNVLTNIPVRDSIANALSASKKRKANQPVKPRAKKNVFTKQTRRSPTPSSSSESETEVPFMEDSDSDDGGFDYESLAYLTDNVHRQLNWPISRPIINGRLMTFRPRLVIK